LQWEFVPVIDKSDNKNVDKGLFVLQNRHSGKVAEAQFLPETGNGRYNGARIQQWTYSGGRNQRWKLIDPNGAINLADFPDQVFGEFHGVGSQGKCLEVGRLQP
jgi:hypothetical protein